MSLRSTSLLLPTPQSTAYYSLSAGPAIRPLGRLHPAVLANIARSGQLLFKYYTFFLRIPQLPADSPHLLPSPPRG